MPQQPPSKKASLSTWLMPTQDGWGGICRAHLVPTWDGWGGELESSPYRSELSQRCPGEEQL